MKSLPINNIGSPDKIPQKYKPAIDSIMYELNLICGHSLYSSYVRGSVSNGRVTKYSDLDIVAVLLNTSRINLRQSLINKKVLKIQKLNKFINGIDIELVSRKQLLGAKKYSNLRINLKHSSVLLMGIDIRPYLPPLAPGPSLSKQMYNYAKNEYNDLMDYFMGHYEKAYLGKIRPTVFWCSWIARVISRSGIGLAMTGMSVYDNDAKKILSLINRNYPQFKRLFQQSTVWIVKPTRNRSRIASFYTKEIPPYFEFWKKQLTKSL